MNTSTPSQGGGRNRCALGLEMLESRTVMNAAPVIANFAMTPQGEGLYSFTGQVIDENPEGLAVDFSGDPCSINGARAFADTSGYFELIIYLNNDGSDDGDVYAVAEDWYGLFCDPVQVNVQASL